MTFTTTVLERRPDLLDHRPDLVPPIPPDPHPDDVEALEHALREAERPVDADGGPEEPPSQ